MLNSFWSFVFSLKYDSRNLVQGLSTRWVNIIDNIIVHEIYEINARRMELVYINIEDAMLFTTIKCVRYKPNDNSPSFKKSLFENTLATFMFVLVMNINNIADMG